MDALLFEHARPQTLSMIDTLHRSFVLLNSPVFALQDAGESSVPYELGRLTGTILFYLFLFGAIVLFIRFLRKKKS